MNRFLVIFGKPRYLGLLEASEEQPLFKGETLVVESARGMEHAVVAGPISSEQEQVYRDSRSGESDGPARGGEPLLQDVTYLRSLTAEDEAERLLQRTEEEGILRQARTILQGHTLAMKLVDVEYLLDRKKLFFYFTAEQRVDFRAFVRDLAREFRTRIELRQIGIRDEAKVVKGIAPCGQPCCCSYWLHRFMPICIKMVKEQNLALNPTKISGLCGRLMCCMSYEHDVYHDLWKGLPNPGSKIRTQTGTYILCGVDLATQSVRVLPPGGGDLLVPVDRFPEFKRVVTDGGTWQAEEATSAALEGAETVRPEISDGGRLPDRKRPRKPHQEASLPEEPVVRAEKPSGEEPPVAPEGEGEEENKTPKKRRRRRKSKNKPRQEEPKEQEERAPADSVLVEPAPSEGERPKKRRRRPRGRKPKSVSEGTEPS